MVMRSEGRRTQEAGVGMENEWIERTAWWEVQLGHRAGSKCACVTFLTLGVSVISWKVTYCKRQKVHIMSLCVTYGDMNMMSNTPFTLLTTQSPKW